MALVPNLDVKHTFGGDEQLVIMTRRTEGDEEVPSPIPTLPTTFDAGRATPHGRAPLCARDFFFDHQLSRAAVTQQTRCRLWARARAYARAFSSSSRSASGIIGVQFRLFLARGLRRRWQTAPVPRSPRRGPRPRAGGLVNSVSQKL